MDLKIDLKTDEMKELVSEALMKSLDEQKRNALIQGAIAHLLAPREGSGYYGRKASPIEDAFNEAVTFVARDVARKRLEEDATIQAKLAELLNEALARLMSENRTKTVEKIADALAAGMAYRDRD